MLKLKLQYFGHLMQRTDSFEKTLILGKIEGGRRRGWQRMRWLDSITNSMDVFEQAQGVGNGQGRLACYSPWGSKELAMTERLNWTELSVARPVGKRSVVLAGGSADAMLVQRGVQSVCTWLSRLWTTCVSSDRSCCVHTGDAGPLGTYRYSPCVYVKGTQTREKKVVTKVYFYSRVYSYI